MNEKEMREILEEQFKFLKEASKMCEPEHLESITNAMLNIYSTIHSYQFSQE